MKEIKWHAYTNFLIDITLFFWLTKRIIRFQLTFKQYVVMKKYNKKMLYKKSIFSHFVVYPPVVTFVCMRNHECVCMNKQIIKSNVM